MAGKNPERYVRYYTFGSAAAKLDRQEPIAVLPGMKKAPQKRRPIAVDPVAAVGCAVAVLLAVLMVVGMFRVSGTAAQVQQVQTRITGLEQEQKMLRERYENSYNLEEVRAAARSLGMIPAEDAVHIRVNVPAETIQVPQMSWWNSLMTQLREFFA